VPLKRERTIGCETSEFDEERFLLHPDSPNQVFERVSQVVHETVQSAVRAPQRRPPARVSGRHFQGTVRQSPCQPRTMIIRMGKLNINTESDP
jgi:hypothetical protein